MSCTSHLSPPTRHPARIVVRGPVKTRAETQPLCDRPLQRELRLSGGLVLYGVALALLVRARLGVDPWTVLAPAWGASAR